MSEVVKVMIAKKCLSARFPSDLVRKRDGKRDPRHSQSVSHHCVLSTQKTEKKTLRCAEVSDVMPSGFSCTSRESGRDKRVLMNFKKDIQQIVQEVVDYLSTRVYQ